MSRCMRSMPVSWCVSRLAWSVLTMRRMLLPMRSSNLGSGSLETVDDQRAYLYRSVLNEVRMRHRSTMRRRAREMRTAVSEAIFDPEVRPEVMEAMSVLTAKQRAAVVLTYWEDLSPSEVAQRLGVSEGTVRRHLARGRSKLREVLNV